MINETFTKNGETYRQVNKTTANKLFDKGVSIYLLPSNMYFHNIWVMPCPISSKLGSTFNNRCNEFKCYNCDNERGRYIHFFVKETNN